MIDRQLFLWTEIFDEDTRSQLLLSHRDFAEDVDGCLRPDELENVSLVRNAASIVAAVLQRSNAIKCPRRYLRS